jgi:hypothetical protein
MRKQIRYLLSGSFLGLIVLLVWSCYPSSPTSATETGIVVTLYDSGFNFGAAQTYALPDTVFDLPGSSQVSHQFDSLILSEVDKSMAGRGYVKELNPAQNGADVVVIISVSKQAISYVDYSWYAYWGSWPGWAYWGSWDSTWGFRYPWASIETFSSGSLFLEMVDPNGRDSQNKKLPVRWTGVIDGLLDSSATVTSDQIVKGIGQCFAQSPYLGK